MGDLGVQVSSVCPSKPHAHPYTMTKTHAKFQKDRYKTCFSMGDLGVQVSSVRPSVHPSVNIYHGCLVNATSLTVFLPTFLKLCRCFLHGVRMCMWFGYICPFCRTCFSMGDLGLQASVCLSVRSSICPSVNIYHGCLVNATPLTVFY